MKPPLAALLAAVLSVTVMSAQAQSAPAAQTPAATPDPQPGQTVSSVYAALGQPAGVIEAPQKTLLMYDRGDVAVSDGLVVEVKLMSPADYTTKLAQDADAEAQRQAERTRVNALRDKLLNDPAYLNLPTRDRIIALQRFNRENPGSDVYQDIQDLIVVYAAEQNTQAKLTELKNEVAQARVQTTVAQQQAAVAEQQAATAQKQAAVSQQQVATARRQAAVAFAQPYPVYTYNIVNTFPGGTMGKAGGGGVVITGGGVATKPQKPTIITNDKVVNPPPGGVNVVNQDGSITNVH